MSVIIVDFFNTIIVTKYQSILPYLKLHTQNKNYIYMLYIRFIKVQFMYFNLFYVGDYCQGWGREFESRFPLQI
ncbi:hypothetical protein F949_02792 [Acinetobacter junii NIPH 182]|nr:hypothetical protein F949_02792 [Acinetobacter junii NIPH 182]